MATVNGRKTDFTTTQPKGRSMSRAYVTLPRMAQTRLYRLPAAFLVLVFLLGGMPALAREAGLARGVTKKELSIEPLAGDPTKEVVTDLYSIPTGAVLPWHIHPDAHEISYVLSGELTLEVQGEKTRHLKVGESFYLHPNKIHRGLNEGAGLVKLFVVRIKPVDKPVTVEVEPDKSSAPSNQAGQ